MEVWNLGHSGSFLSLSLGSFTAIIDLMKFSRDPNLKKNRLLLGFLLDVFLKSKANHI